MADTNSEAQSGPETWLAARLALREDQIAALRNE